MAVPAVTIIIPTFNRLGFLQQALDSVRTQTFGDYEVIVVDDGSTESIGPAIATHPVRPEILRLEKRRGPAAARNRGLRAARADIIAFLDSDDLWLPRKLERFLAALRENNNTRVYYGPMLPIDARGAPVAGRTKPCHNGRITAPLFQSSFVHVPTVVCRRELLERAGGFDESLRVCEDYDLWLRLSLDEPFGLIEEPLAMRRLHPHRLSKEHMSSNLAVKAHVLRRFYANAASRKLIPRDAAYSRLARACFTSARAALWSGDFQLASEMCRACREHGGPTLRCLPMAAISGFMSILATGRRFEPVAPMPHNAPVKSPAQPG